MPDQFNVKRHHDLSARAEEIRLTWQSDARWKGVHRHYSASDVVRLQGSIVEEATLARTGAHKLWKALHEPGHINAFGTLTGLQAVQEVQAGIKAIYVSGYQVAADGNLSGHTYPDQSLYPANSVPTLVRRINNALARADQIALADGNTTVADWFVPVIADAEAGFGGPVNAFELQKSMIQAGAAAVHWEDQLAPAKVVGERGGKVILPTSHHIEVLTAARLASDVLDVPTVIIARTDAESASFLTSDIDERDAPFLTGERNAQGFYEVRRGIDACIARSKAYAPYADVLWMETSRVDLAYARQFAEAIKAEFPDKVLAYNCYPGFNWTKELSQEQIGAFQRELGSMGFAFQFITLGGFHVIQHGTFDFAKAYVDGGMTAYAALQERKLANVEKGYSAHAPAHFVGGDYFDLVGAAVRAKSTDAAGELKKAV